MRDKLDIEATSRTPAVGFDFAGNHLKISGESYPEDVTEFYRPVFDALDEYLGGLGQGSCRFDFELIYLNSSSAKAVMMLMDKLEAAAANGASVDIHWLYDKEDDTMQGTRRGVWRGSRIRQVPSREDVRLMSSDDLFGAEERALAAAQELIESGRFAELADGKRYEALVKDYQKLLRATRRLMRLSDRNEEQLNALTKEQRQANEVIAQKNKALDALATKLSKYLSPQIYHSIFTGAQNVEIASSRKKLTIFFSDVVNFTETTDKMESEDLTNLLNRYLTEMTNIALEHGATIDKYIGDAIMVFFGDPASKGVKEDARACVRMAIAMLKRLAELHTEWLELGAEQPFHLRIGINTAYVTVGNFGSDDRMDYTIIGSGVNATARLESFAETDGILIGHETYALVKDEVNAEEQEPIKVKGFAEPLRCYKVLGLYDDLVAKGSVIREEQDGFKLLLDLNKHDRAEAIAALQAIVDRLKE